jgi:hypothetical protein
VWWGGTLTLRLTLIVARRLSPHREREESFLMKPLIINDASQSIEKCYNALRGANVLLEKESTEVNCSPLLTLSLLMQPRSVRLM